MKDTIEVQSVSAVSDATHDCATCAYQPVKGVVGLPPMCTHPFSPRDVFSPYPWSCECMRANGACGRAGRLWEPRKVGSEPPKPSWFARVLGELRARFPAAHDAFEAIGQVRKRGR